MAFPLGPQFPKRASQWYKPCTVSSMDSVRSPCESDVSSCPPKKNDGRDARMPVAGALAAMGSVGLQPFRTVMPPVQCLQDHFQLVFGSAISTRRRLRSRRTLGRRLGSHFHFIDHDSHFKSPLSDLRG